MRKKFLLIDGTNFINYPAGGTLSFDRQLLKVLSPEHVAVVGITTQKHRVGEWTTIIIDGKNYDFFPFMRVAEKRKKPIIPLRITSLFSLALSLRKIRRKGYLHVFTQTPQLLFALKFFTWESICFYFAGVGNSVALSRFPMLRVLGNSYEKRLFKVLKNHVNIILAAADKKSIKELIDRSDNLLSESDVTSFPTRYDNAVFKPMDKDSCRKELGLPIETTILVAVGRLCWVKGWDLLLKMMEIKGNRKFLLIFVGDGEDREIIEKKTKQLSDVKSVIITGFISPDEVSKYINASDITLVGSYQEGWSTTMVEALACGKPIVSTNVSGASDLIKEGENGFILYERNPSEMLKLIDKALQLSNAKDISISIARNYSLDTLYNDLSKVWPNAQLGNQK